MTDEKNINPIDCFVFVEGDGKMKFRVINIAFILLLIIASFSLFITNVKSSENEIYVKSSFSGFSDGSAEKPYQTINKALSYADEGDIIYIFGGEYQENLIIDKKVKVIGSIDEEETIINTRFDKRYLVEINADGVTIEGINFSDKIMTMTSPIGALLAINSNNNAIVRNKFTNNVGYGIYIASSSNNNLISNNYINHVKEGIHVSLSYTNDLANNQIHNSTEYGIYMDSSGGNNRLYSNYIYNCPSGVYIRNTNNINITFNTITKSNFYAIYLSQSQGAEIINNLLTKNTGDGIYSSATDCIIKNNTMRENRRGLTLSGSDNIIKNNTFIESTASGINVYLGSNDNIIYLNKFLNNEVSAKDKGNNHWFYLSKGNYWSDYNNIDKNLDGIGDVVYSKSGVVDSYPLGYFLKPPNKPSNPIPKDTATDVSLNVNLKIDVDDPDSKRLNVYFYGGVSEENNTVNITLIESQTRNPFKNVLRGSTVECSFTLGFNTTYAWYVIVDDGLLQNRSDTYFFYTTKTPPDNKPPVADAGGPYYANINETIIFDASKSYDPDGEIEFYRWNFGDGTSEILSMSPTHKYLNSGEYSVVLTIIDDNGTSEMETTKVIISSTARGNESPIADAGGPYYGEAGKLINFDGSNSYDPDYGDNIAYEWDFGDGSTSNQKNPNHYYSSAGNFTIKLTVTDETGKTDTATNYALIKTKKTDESPGFEIIISILTILCLFIIMRKKEI
jgi:parallel beta-helix repeat protein